MQISLHVFCFFFLYICMLLLKNFKYMHLPLFIEYILSKLENNVFLGRKTIFSFATSCNF